MKQRESFNLKEYNSYNIDSTCSIAWFPEREEDFIQLFQNKDMNKLIVLGNGNNIILSKKHYKKEFVILNKCFDKIIINDKGIIEAEAGATFSEISQIALDKNLTGFEVFCDIPSSVGGGVVMNAGTKEGEIKDILVKVRYLDLKDMKVKEKLNNDINFEYRNSFFQKNKDKIVLKSWFQLEAGSYESIKAKMDSVKSIRWSKQPREYPNGGSVFKRPAGRFVGPMLDELNLKGYTVGGAQVSKKHSGFIVNVDNAKGKDVLGLISEIQKKVFEKFEIVLEVEQRII